MRKLISVGAAGVFLLGGRIVGGRHLPTLGTGARVADKTAGKPAFGGM